MVDVGYFRHSQQTCGLWHSLLIVETHCTYCMVGPTGGIYNLPIIPTVRKYLRLTLSPMIPLKGNNKGFKTSQLDGYVVIIPEEH